jgi:hypothetical protein
MAFGDASPPQPVYPAILAAFSLVGVEPISTALH